MFLTHLLQDACFNKITFGASYNPSKLKYSALFLSEHFILPFFSCEVCQKKGIFIFTWMQVLAKNIPGIFVVLFLIKQFNLDGKAN